MVTVTSSGGVKKVFLSSNETKALEIISINKSLNVPPRDTMKQLKEEGITNKEIMGANRAMMLFKQGAEKGYGYAT